MGEIVRVLIEGKRRPAVILNVEPDFVRVAYGTSVAREWRRVTVNPNTRQGRAFDIPETTYFYGANTSFELPKDLEFLGGTCSKELLFEIRSVVEERDAAIEEP